MPDFRYRAVTGAGQVVEGRMEAASRDEVIARLRHSGHLPIRADAAHPSLARLTLPRLTRRPPGARELALATRELSTLLGAGLPLERCLEIITRSDTPLRPIWTQVLDGIRGGVTLSDALAAQGSVFPPAFIGMVRAGEAGGALSGVLARLADYLERAQALRETVRSALIYPALLAIMMVATILLLLVVVLPRFQALFADAGTSLPASAAALVWLGQALGQWWWALAIVAGLVPVGVRSWLTRPANRLAWHRLILRLPGLGTLASRADTARFARMMATLVGNGIAIPQALGMARDTLRNAALRRDLDTVEADLRHGRGLSAPLAERRVLTPLAISLIRVGEETGRVQPMLEKVADIHEEDTARTVRRLLALLVPVLTVLMGLMVAAIIGSILSAMLGVYDLSQ